MIATIKSKISLNIAYFIEKQYFKKAYNFYKNDTIL